MATSVAIGSPLPESGAFSSVGDVDADVLIDRSRQLAATPLGDRDRLASLLLGGSFLAVSTALAVFAHSSRQTGCWTLVVFVAPYALASRIDFVGRIVRSCHEDWDGTGYPDGLVAEEIPLVARTVRACDAFSAMTTDRSYRKARPVEEAVAELRRCSGTDSSPTTSSTYPGEIPRSVT
jgi:hypothetical protein